MKHKITKERLLGFDIGSDEGDKSVNVYGYVDNNKVVHITRIEELK